MDILRSVWLAITVLGTTAFLGFGQSTDATRVLSAARSALGGEKALLATKTFVATGRTRQLRGNNLVPIDFEINCGLPHRFVRKADFRDVDDVKRPFRIRRAVGDQTVEETTFDRVRINTTIDAKKFEAPK